MEEETAVEKRSKRVRRRDTTHAEEAADPSATLAALQAPYQEVDKNLFEAGELSLRLTKWQQWRSERVKRVFELNGMIEARRTPTGERTSAQSFLAAKEMDLGWLFGVDFEKEVESWQ